MPARLPVKLKKTPGGYAIQCGGDARACLYVYTETERVNRRHLSDSDGEEFAKDVARALRQAWVVLGKQGG